MNTTNKPKVPKRRNAPKTKAAILAAAQKAFSKHSFSQVGIRDIAAIANVTSPMLLRYFGSKEGLFEAALIDAIDIKELLTMPKEGFGELLAKLFLDTSLDIKPPAIVALSAADSEARAIVTRVMEEYALTPFSKWLGPPDARVRAYEISLLSMGFVLHTRQLPLMSAPKSFEKKMAAWFSETVQRIIDQT